MADASIESFIIQVDDSALKDLSDRLSRTRLPMPIPGSGWDYGVEIDYLSDLLDYWRTDFDWRAAEAALNRFPHFRTTIDDHAIHFMHVRSAHAGATPLLLVHGWPGSFIEFIGVIDRLTSPEKYGGGAADAFHLVIPSLPGFVFSEQPKAPGWGPRHTGEVYTELMSRLNYDRYGVQGGDFGAMVVAEMALADTGRIIGLHTNMPMALPPEVPVPLTAQEEKDVADIRHFAEKERAYAYLQGTKPQTIGVSLNDSPAGLCAWFLEKFRTWSDCDGDIESVINRETLITNIMLYWVTGTPASAARYYFEYSHETPTWAKGRIEVPCGIARFPKEMNRPPRTWVERQMNVVHWSILPRGGHFAALEQPEIFSKDVIAFFGRLRG